MPIRPISHKSLPPALRVSGRLALKLLYCQIGLPESGETASVRPLPVVTDSGLSAKSGLIIRVMSCSPPLGLRSDRVRLPWPLERTKAPPSGKSACSLRLLSVCQPPP